jgi:glycerol uptake facilitator protein
MSNIKEYIGEFIGTSILVLFGCGCVATAVFFNAFGSLLEVAILFGLGVTLAIFTVRNYCPAHLNPAVSVAMVISGNLPARKLPFFILSQLLGGAFGAIILFVIFNGPIEIFEETNQIIRGSQESYRSAMAFGEFFPNPSFEKMVNVSTTLACFLEAFGTFILVYVIYKLTERKEQTDNLTPILIGLTVTALICLIAPFTQAGFNPARDFSPRIIAYFGGWKEAAFPSVDYSFFTVYILSPIVGGICAALLQRNRTKTSSAE